MIMDDPDPLAKWLPRHLSHVAVHDVQNDRYRFLLGSAAGVNLA